MKAAGAGAKVLEAIPSFALGMGIRKAGDEGVMGFPEGVAEGMAMHGVGELGQGLSVIPRVAAQAAGQGALAAGMTTADTLAKTGQLPTGEQVTESAATGAAMGVPFALTPRPMGVARPRDSGVRVDTKGGDMADSLHGVADAAEIGRLNATAFPGSSEGNRLSPEQFGAFLTDTPAGQALSSTIADLRASGQGALADILRHRQDGGRPRGRADPVHDRPGWPHAPRSAPGAAHFRDGAELLAGPVAQRREGRPGHYARQVHRHLQVPGPESQKRPGEPDDAGHPGVGQGRRPSFMHLLAAPLAMGGVSTGLGAVGWTAAKAIHSTLGDSRDPKEAFFSWVRRALGQDAEQYARFGAFGALGIDVSGSMDTQIRMSASLKDLAGPIGGVANDLVGDRGAAHYLATGQPGKALEKALPTGVANPFQAMRENTEGVTSSRGYPWRDDQGGNYMPTQAETAAKAMGFR